MTVARRAEWHVPPLRRMAHTKAEKASLHYRLKRSEWVQFPVMGWSEQSKRALLSVTYERFNGGGRWLINVRFYAYNMYQNTKTMKCNSELTIQGSIQWWDVYDSGWWWSYSLSSQSTHTVFIHNLFHQQTHQRRPTIPKSKLPNYFDHKES